MWLGIIGLVFILTGLLLALRRKKRDKENYQHKKNASETKPQKTTELQQPSENSRKVSEQLTNQNKSKKSKGKKQTDPSLDILDKQFVGSIKVPGITAIDIKQSKLLIATSNNQLQYFDLKQFKKENPTGCKKGYQHLESRGTAVFIGTKYMYVAVQSDKTVLVFEFIGQNGVYFKLVTKLPRTIHNSEILTVYTDQKEQFILTAGFDDDTTLKVFNLKGQKLHQTNTSQVRHYAVKITEDILCLKSWAPSYKLFKICSDKKSSSFLNIQKSLQLSHQDGIIDGAIDILGNHAITIRKNKSICIWKIDFNQKSSVKRKEVSDHKELSECTLCEIHTIQSEDARLRTIVGLSGGKSLHLTDLDLNVKHTFNLPEREKDNIGYLRLIGKKNLIVFGITKESGRVYMWNAGEILNGIQKYQH